jgi:hypothetical protein
MRTLVVDTTGFTDEAWLYEKAQFTPDREERHTVKKPAKKNHC